MIHDRRRFIPVLISVNPRAPADVHILQIAVMALVKISDLLKGTHPVDRRRGAARKHRRGPVISLSRLSTAAGKGPAQCAVFIARVVDHMMVGVGQQLCLHAEDALLPGNCRQQTLHTVLRDKRVVVKQHDIRRPGEVYSAVDRMAEPGVGPEGEQRDPPRVLLLHHLPAAVRGRIVHDNNLRNYRAGEEGVETVSDIGNAVVIGNHNSDTGFWHITSSCGSKANGSDTISR